MARRPFWPLAAVVVAVVLGATPPSRGQGFTITVDFGGGLTASQETVFATAASFWESHITGYRPAGVTLTGVTISASGVAIDGPGGTLGSSGPTASSFQGGFRYATAGTMQFDTADLAQLQADGTLQSVITHEMAHVLGFGTMWTNNGVYTNGSGRFTGANALAAYQTEFNQPSAAFVPVELSGGAGTANSHWNERNGGGANTGIVDSQGRDMRFELMTGWLDAPTFVSDMTIESFADIGYVVAPVPEPASSLGIGTVVVAAVGLCRRRTPTSAT